MQRGKSEYAHQNENPILPMTKKEAESLVGLTGNNIYQYTCTSLFTEWSEIQQF